MVTRRRSAVPSYRKHRPSGQAVVTLNGRDFYLGPHGTQVSKAEYDRLILEWLAAGRQIPAGELGSSGILVRELSLRYWEHAKTYYRKEGSGTSEVDNIRGSLKRLRKHYGHVPVASFGPTALKALREGLIAEGLSRTTINGVLNRIRRTFRWGVAEELVRPDTLQALEAVPGLRRGRSAAREPEPVGTVSEEHVQAVLPLVSRQVAAMIQLQQLTGMRPGEVVQMRGQDLDRNDDLWIYRPARHKTQHHGIERVIHLGPQAQEILRSFLQADPQAPLFSPKDADRERKAKMRLARQTRVQPSQFDRTKSNAQRKPGATYTTATYYRAILRACELARIPSWAPNQLRHTALTEIQRKFGWEAARVCGGHTSVATTGIYVERDGELARKVMGAAG